MYMYICAHSEIHFEVGSTVIINMFIVDQMLYKLAYSFISKHVYC